MPSDAKKKQAQKKKDAAKARQGGKKPTTNAKGENGEKESSPSDLNGTPEREVNGSVEISAEGIYIFVSYFTKSKSIFIFKIIK